MKVRRCLVVTVPPLFVGCVLLLLYYALLCCHQEKSSAFMAHSEEPRAARPGGPGEAEPGVPREAEPGVPGEAEPGGPGEAEPAVPGEAEPAVPREAVPRETTTETQNDVGEAVINPGCKKRRLKDYRAVDTGKTYDHPSIVHYYKLSRSDGLTSINFREYTSVLSVYKFLKPERIVFYVNSNTLGGYYWNIINTWADVVIQVRKVPQASTIGGKYVPWITHEADYVKLKTIYQSGGLALDFDVIIVNGTRLKREQNLSECVLSEEGEYINGGFYSCIRRSPYIAKWLNSYDTDYRPELWLHNVSFKPRDFLIEPDSSNVCYNVHLDDTICIHPNWGKQREWLKKNSVNWRTKTAAHYFVKNNIRNDGKGLLKEDHSLADLIRYVHKA